MASMLEREEWKAFSDFSALAAAGLLTFIGLILAIAGKDPVIAFHGCVLLGAAGLAFLYILTQVIEKKEPRDKGGYADGVIRAGVIATVFWGVAGFLVGDHHRLAARLSRRSTSICRGPASGACGRCTPRP